ncbi:hypothetical protein G6F56_002654 [Rhizopus delemar]|nr:hypothetical protein G6F56_002654 [Rhizopus delemar]
MFHYSDYRQVFLLNKKYMVQHLSQGALASLLGEFCDFGTILSKLRGMASRILSDDSRYGQTAQAFATAVYKSLLSFEGQLSTLERDTRFITKDPSKTISVLKLRNALRTQLQCFQEIHSISKCIPFEDSSPKLIAYHLLSTLYERALTSQLSGQNTLYNAILYTLQQTVVPFGRLMDDWMFRGSLEGDKLKEFYVTRNDEISMDDPNFWTKGFSIQLTSQDTALIYCPLFEKRNVERIYFTGKAINLLLKIKKIQNEQVDFDQKPTLFSTIVGNAFPMQQPFIDTTDNTVGNDPEEAYDIFTQSLLSMVNTSKKPAPQDVSRSISSHDVLLFDQNFIQCIERYIQKPYMNTANRLNTALHNNCGLSAQLRLLASVYLMLENDMMHSFCEMIFAQIDNKENWFEKRSLNGTFVEACESNGYDESVCIDMESIHPRNQPTKGISETMASVLQFISFKISIPWPLNNFIQEDILIQYSKIAKFLLRLKRAKHVLEKKISFKGRVKYGKNDADYTWLYSVRMKMLWFVNTFWRYIMVTVLHVETINFHRSLSNSTNVDEITIFHVAYVSRIVEKCMLDEKSAIINMSILKMLGMAENLAGVFLKYIDTEEQIIKRSYQEHSPEDFVFDMSSIEKEFNLTNEFVLNGLLTLSKKSGLMWCETLAASLNAQQPTNN